MRIENTGSGYAGASYTLFYKDGKTEYFNSAGRLIAIVDRYGNAITFAYTLNGGRVSQIQITDTLGHNIVYADSNVNPGVLHYVDGHSGDFITGIMPNGRFLWMAL